MTAIHTQGRPVRTSPAATAAGWALAAVLAAAPLLGGTRPVWAVTAVEVAAAVAVVAWVGIRRRVPAVPGGAAVCVGLLLCLGWASAANPRSRYDAADRRLLPTVGGAVPGLPATVDFGVSVEAMVRLTVLAGLFVACCDAVAVDPRSARRLLVGVAVGGAGVAVLGLGVRLGWVPPLAPPEAAGEGYAFGPFAYHANAGAALNLGLAAALGWAAVAPGPGAVAAVLCLGGATVNVSRAAQVLTVATVGLMGIAWWRHRRPGPLKPTWPLVVGVIAVIAVAGVGGGRAWHRWGTVGTQLRADSARPTLWRICLGLARSAGPFGTGPGTFKVLLPMAPGLAPLYDRYIVTWYVPGEPVSMWSNAHQDPLQTAIEWGWVGGVPWAVLLVGGLIRRRPAADPWPATTARVALGVVCLHALLDFPLQVFCIQIQAAALLGILWSRRKNPVDFRPRTSV